MTPNHPVPTSSRLVAALAAAPLALSGCLLGFLWPSTASAQSPTAPCTDGVFYGDVSGYYQDILAEHATDPSTSRFSTLSLEKKNMVTECAGRTDGPDSERYSLREVATDGQGNIIARVYHYLDPAQSQVCQEAPLAPNCRQGQYYYVALVMSGCYTDNVFGDDDYATSVGWQGTGSQGTGYVRLRQSDQGVINASCQGSPGFNMNPVHLDLAGLGNDTDGGGTVTGDADNPGFNENVISGTLPFGFHAATSSVWNMLLSRWDAGDSNADDNEERDGDEDDWSSPWVLPASGSDLPVGSATPLCSGLVCDLGYATTWFDDVHMWEWQVVYEFRWDVSSCTPIDPVQWALAFNSGTHASPSKKNWEQCANPANLGALTIIKDSVPDNPWNDFLFTLSGPDPGTPVVLQDPGIAECNGDPQWPACGLSTPWNAPDRFSRTDLIPTNNAPFIGGPYQLTESAVVGTDLTGYETSWECRNVDPTACSAAVAASVDDPFTLAACAPVQPLGCGTVAGFVGGAMTGTGFATPDFSICKGAHVICQFTNEGGEDECVASANAIGDLQVFGGVQSETAAFSTAAVPLQSADAPDSIFLASFVPLADQARWPGNLDHFVLPLPLVENGELPPQLVPDFSVVCADDDDTACLAWRAGDELVTQAPTAAEVTTDRRIGLGADQRRVTYSQAASGDQVPRTIRRFDWSDSDSITDEHDLWEGLGLSFVAGDTTSEAGARTTARSIVNQTLQQRQVTIPDPDAPGTQTLTYVAGDFFHSDPQVVSSPSNFFFLANDLEGNGRACDDTTTPNRGYRCFFEKNRRRRQVVVAASNDGEIHAFDAGQFEGDVVSQKLEGKFTFGTGKELFAHLPRPMLEHVTAMAQGEHDFGVDGGLVVDDVFIDPFHDGSPNLAQREWRTVIFGSYREGDRGLVALDVTQPDPIEKVNITNFAGQQDIAWLPVDSVGVVPGCAELGGTPSSGCGTLSYPAQLWEFDDPDLGASWSQVNTGRILVKVLGEDVVKFVAVFGGGLDPENRRGVGNWLYMVDIETGKAIYKRPVTSGVPSEPAAVDTDQDGFLDTIYFGTVGDDSDQDTQPIVNALLYKVDLSTPADVDPATGRISDPTQWAPFPIFDTGTECHSGAEAESGEECHVRPIFYPPTVTFVASQGRYALAFGTGDREDLFGDAGHGPGGRFYVILDPGFQPGTGVLSSGPLNEGSFQQIAADAAGATGDFLTAPLSGLQPGWVLQLVSDERVVTKALLISGLLVFSTFTSDENPAPLCTYEGSGNIYSLLATNANSIAGIEEPRATVVEGLAGRPVVMPEGLTTTGESGEVDPFAAAQIEGIRENLMDLFPADCRFGNFSLNVAVTLSNTSTLPVASVPVCVARKNWTEHF